MLVALVNYVHWFCHQAVYVHGLGTAHVETFAFLGCHLSFLEAVDAVRETPSTDVHNKLIKFALLHVCLFLSLGSTDVHVLKSA